MNISKTARGRTRPRPEAPAGRRLHAEVGRHYRSCLVDPAFISDIWARTLEHWGGLYPLETMLRMLELGNPVNSWIDDPNYLIDATILDLGNPITAELLRRGESDFGHPRRDVEIAGRHYSSNFIHHVAYATKIIAAIAERGLTRPSVLEIGGGLAGIGYLLRSYFGDRLTYYAADLPQTLMMQEWYLRNCFPEARTSFKGTARPFEPALGGLNFINAFVLDSQDLRFDVAINIDSMQEMDRNAVETYLRYIEKNISPNGIFYFQNHYGHGPESVPEPSEYPLDGRWTLRAAEFVPQVECCTGAEQPRLIYHRSSASEDPSARRLILRLLWNGFRSGRIRNDSSLVAKLVRLPRSGDADASARAAGEILRRHGAKVAPAFVAALGRSAYFPHRSYSEVMNTAQPAGDLCLQERHAHAAWAAQSRLINLMRDAGRNGTAKNPRLAVGAVCRALTTLKDTARSEYWSGYVGSMLCALGRKEEVRGLLEKASDETRSPIWLTRFAHLLCRTGSIPQARRLLARVSTQEDYFAGLKAAELEHACGDTLSAKTRVEAARAEAASDLPRLLCLAKTAARLGFDVIAEAGAAAIIERFPESGVSALQEIIAASSAKTLPPFTRTLAARLPPPGVNAADSLAHGFLMLRLGDAQAPARLSSLQRGLTEARDYYRLGLMGKQYLQAGLEKAAHECLQQSLSLRDNSFKHYEFAGNAYLGTGRFKDARECYRRALALKPYLRHLLAKEAYCGLPAAVQASGVFGQAADLRMIFPIEQDYYHDLGPKSK